MLLYDYSGQLGQARKETGSLTCERESLESKELKHLFSCAKRSSTAELIARKSVRSSSQIFLAWSFGATSNLLRRSRAAPSTCCGRAAGADNRGSPGEETVDTIALGGDNFKLLYKRRVEIIVSTI